MVQQKSRTLVTVASLSAALASVSGTAVVGWASMAGASPSARVAADGQDINNDWGQTAEEIAAEIRAQVAAMPKVIDTKQRYQRALHVVDMRRKALKDAERDYKQARRTHSKKDDRKAKARLVRARENLAQAIRDAKDAKAAWERAKKVATAQITSQHYVLDPTPTDTVTPTPTDTVTPTPTDTVTPTPTDTVTPTPTDTVTPTPTDTVTPTPTDTVTPTPTDTVTPTPTDTVTPTPISGTFLGLANDANPYGTMQVQITLVDSVITVVTTPVYPTTSDSKDINAKALPILQSRAIVAQSAKIASVSGATYSSKAFKQSLQSALVISGLDAQQNGGA